MTRSLAPVLAVLACACGALQPVTEPVTTHVLSARPPAAATAASQRDIAIEVVMPRAWPGFDTADMIYQREPYQLQRFAVNRWIDTPPRMLAPLIVRALEDSGAFRAVVQAPPIAPAEYRLDTEVVQLVQDFAGRPSLVRIAVRAQITDLRTRRVVATRVLEDTEPAATDTPAGGAAAANVALGRVLSQLVRFCTDATARP